MPAQYLPVRPPNSPRTRVRPAPRASIALFSHAGGRTRTDPPPSDFSVVGDAEPIAPYGAMHAHDVRLTENQRAGAAGAGGRRQRNSIGFRTTTAYDTVADPGAIRPSKLWR
jgi:hypothetical protein